jgi:hypothetical protein
MLPHPPSEPAPTRSVAVSRRPVLSPWWSQDQHDIAANTDYRDLMVKTMGLLPSLRRPVPTRYSRLLGSAAVPAAQALPRPACMASASRARHWERGGRRGRPVSTRRSKECRGGRGPGGQERCRPGFFADTPKQSTPNGFRGCDSYTRCQSVVVKEDRGAVH